MQSYLNSPQYQMLLAQALQNPGGASQYPGQAIANIGAQLANALALKRYETKQQTKEQDYAKALGGIGTPDIVDQVAITPSLANSETSAGDYMSRQAMGAYDQPIQKNPDTATMLARLLATGNSDVTNDFAPVLLKSQIEQNAQANQPITPYQRWTMAQQMRTTETPEQRQANALALKAAPGPAPQPSVGMTPEAEAQAARLKGVPGPEQAPLSPERYRQDLGLAQAKADAAAANAGLFGRGLEGKSYNILARGLTDEAYRASPEYQTAWQILSNPKVDPATGTVIVPDLSAFKPPAGAQPPAPQQGAQPSAPGQPPQRMPGVQSYAPPNPSQAEAASAGYANRLEDSAAIIDKPEISAAATSLTERAMGAVPAVGNYLVSPEYQQFDQAQRNFINAQLRRESGAVISEEEFANARKQYFPQPGDSQQVLRQKKANRDMAVRNMQLSAGNVLLPPGVIQQSSPARGAPIVPMSQGFGPGGGAPQNPQAAAGAINDARAAIQAGAPREKVIERLRQNGIDPGGL